MSQWKLSVDTGGTFTDCFCETPSGEIKRLKILSNSTLRGKVAAQQSPQSFDILSAWNFDPTLLTGYSIKLYPGGSLRTITSLSDSALMLDRAVENASYTHFEIISDEEVPVFAARLLTETYRNQSIPPMDIRLGTTRGTNALLEKSGAPVVLLITEGFSDLLRIGNQQRPDLFALNVQKPAPLYKQVTSVRERMGANGEVITELTKEECRRVIDLIPEETSVAIAFLHAHRNPVHEGMIEQYLRSQGFKWVCTSSSLSSNSKILHRAQTTVVNAFLLPVMNTYFQSIDGKIEGSLKVMTSAGHLSGMEYFSPKDGLLSGPAGGIKGAAITGRQCGIERMVTFDMGGTSTDVAIYDGAEDYAYETSVGDAVIQAPCLAIETIAAGGGSICSFDGEMLRIGPESAGASPGPACYGMGGPLTVTDINLLCGRLNESNFSIPLDMEASENKLNELLRDVRNAGRTEGRVELLQSLLQLITEKMARSIRHLSIRKGVDVSELALTTFGGAGGQHACDLAEELMIRQIFIPRDAGLLSAHGIRNTEIARFTEREFQEAWQDIAADFPRIREEMYQEGKAGLEEEGYQAIIEKGCYLYLRFKGQESSVEVEYRQGENIAHAFEKNYRRIFGHWLENKELELTSVKVVAAVRKEHLAEANMPDKSSIATPFTHQKMITRDGEVSCGVFNWEIIEPGAVITGPAILGSSNCTVVVKENWELRIDSLGNAHLTHREEPESVSRVSDTAGLALFTNRFSAVVEEMGAILQRTAFSVNVKERVDFSCALMDAKGRLVVNAPHIPVHLGSMGVCVRKVMERMAFNEGDVIITNHPGYGGSHLPDITLIAPVFFDGQLIAVVANRAHHAEIGGKTPGSMPPDATTLEEEGVIFEPTYLIRQGKGCWEDIHKKLTEGKYPSRAPKENLADLRGALASVQAGINSMQRLCTLYGAEKITSYMAGLYDYSGDKSNEFISSLTRDAWRASEELDDGSALQVEIRRRSGGFQFDFTGSSPPHPGNLNATPAIVRSVVLYVLRLMLRENLPLNEGILRDVSINLPPGLLNPDFQKIPLPAVVGGNTEISQRLTDTLLKAFGVAACSYGTMNNVIFGNTKFGFYETICGGTGAGPDFDGCDAVHQHMTNTRITDPEIMEIRYPVRLERFEIRPNSGGKGKFHGGNGVVRVIHFLENVSLSLLTQHRANQPYGMYGGKPGASGRQYVLRGEEKISLASSDYLDVLAGDRLIIETPGGGGWGIQA